MASAEMINYYKIMVDFSDSFILENKKVTDLKVMITIDN
jgi:hypothetical protein